MHRNATLVARYPAVESALGEHFPLFETLLAWRAEGQPAPIRTVSPVDGVERFSTVQSVPGLPLEVLVTRDTRTALAAWREMAWGTVARTLALAALAAALIALLMRQLARLAKVRDSLDASRERFALAVAGSNDGIWDWDYRRKKVFASARARELLGLPPGPELTPSDEWFAACSSSGRRSAKDAALEAHLAGRTPLYEGEYRVRQLDGTYRWVLIRGLCTRDAAGQPLRMAGSVSDVDAQKSAEAALRLSEERYAIAMTGSNEGHWVWDIASDELYASPMVKEVFGLSLSDPIPTRKAFLERVHTHPADRASTEGNLPLTWKADPEDRA
jgi:PAS domain S-box-containing protein